MGQSSFSMFPQVLQKRRILCLIDEYTCTHTCKVTDIHNIYIDFLPKEGLNCVGFGGVGNGCLSAFNNSQCSLPFPVLGSSTAARGQCLTSHQGK